VDVCVIIGPVRRLLYLGGGDMQSNVALHGVCEFVDRDPLWEWSYFGLNPRSLTRGFPWETDWWVELQERWEGWETDTVLEAWQEYAFEPRWAELYLGRPREWQREVSTEEIDAFREIRALQEEFGEAFEQVMLLEDPETLRKLDVRWRLRPW
jgi:hypothetical protein